MVPRYQEEAVVRVPAGILAGCDVVEPHGGPRAGVSGSGAYGARVLVRAPSRLARAAGPELLSEDEDASGLEWCDVRGRRGRGGGVGVEQLLLDSEEEDLGLPPPAMSRRREREELMRAAEAREMREHHHQHHQRPGDPREYEESRRPPPAHHHHRRGAEPEYDYEPEAEPRRPARTGAPTSLSNNQVLHFSLPFTALYVTPASFR